MLALFSVFLVVAAAGTAYLGWQGRPSADEQPENTDGWLSPVTALIAHYQRRYPDHYLVTQTDATYAPVFQPCLDSCRPGQVAVGAGAGDTWFGARLMRPIFPYQNYRYFLLSKTAGTRYDMWGNVVYQSEWDYFMGEFKNRAIANPPGIEVAEGTNSLVYDVPEFTGTIAPDKTTFLAEETVELTLALKTFGVFAGALDGSGYGRKLPIRIYGSKEGGRDAVQVGCVPGNLGYDGHTSTYGWTGETHSHCLNEDHQFVRYPIEIGSFTVNFADPNYPKCDFAVFSKNTDGSCPPNKHDPSFAAVPITLVGSLQFKLPKQSSDQWRFQILGEFGKDAYLTKELGYTKSGDVSTPKLWLSWYTPAVRIQGEDELPVPVAVCTQTIEPSWETLDDDESSADVSASRERQTTTFTIGDLAALAHPVGNGSLDCDIFQTNPSDEQRSIELKINLTTDVNVDDLGGGARAADGSVGWSVSILPGETVTRSVRGIRWIADQIDSVGPPPVGA